MMPEKAVLAATLCCLMLIAPLAASAQPAGTNGADADRRAQISENLQFRFEQLREAQVVVTELGEADVAGFDIGTVVINGRNAMRFLVTKDNTQLYLLAADPVDVSMTKSEVAAEFDRLEREALAEARQRHQQLKVLSKGKPSLGKSSAPVTIVEFSDFECPYCARVVPTVKELLEKYPDDVRIVFMHLPLDMHPWAEPAAVAATCAAQESNDAFWSLHDFYFENQGSIETDNVIDMSRSHLEGTEVDLVAWAECAGNSESTAYKEALSAVRASSETAKKYGATGTPAFFVNGRFLSGAQPLSAFEEIIEEILKTDA
ncbi:MAG: DsbA family protein [Rhodothermia bacterium]|nr:DsbA family protein [Rhodothermia bacterium]